MAETTPSIASRVIALTKMTLPELRQKWLEIFGEPTTQRHRQFLIRRIAWRLQEQHFGGLSEEAQIRLTELQQEFKSTPPETWFRGARHNKPATQTTPVRRKPVRDAKSPRVGSVITRQYRGEQIVVTVLDDHTYEYRGATYRSLSAIATAVTGAHCSGPAFFNLRGKEAKR
jgi:hypothetical protein